MNGNEGCIFCLQYQGIAQPFCKDNPGKGCTYGFHHSFDEPTVAPIQKQTKKVDKQVCLKCNMHIKNPNSNTNGCAHVYT